MKRVVAHPGISPEDRPIGPAPLSPAVVCGNMLFVSGQVAIGFKSGELADHDIAIQFRHTIFGIRALTAAAGMTLDEVVKVEIVLSDLTLFDTMHEGHADFFAAPISDRATVGVGLNRPDLLVEMDAIAMR